MQKILFLGAGSENDPGFARVYIQGKPYKEFMENKGITVLEKVIESCHGCHDLMTDYSQQMQSLVDNGDRVVAVLEGGKYFALPSIQATQVTYPIISSPLDLVSYQAIFLPLGHPVMAGVGVERKIKDPYMEALEKKLPKAKALKLAERMLNMEGDKVDVIKDVSGGKLLEELAKYSIKGQWGKWQESPLSLAYGNDNLDRIYLDSILIRADCDENLRDWEYLKRAEERHHQDDYNVVPTAQVSGLKNLALFAAKIISLQRAYLREKIKEIGEKKEETYEERDLIAEIKDGGK